MELKEKPRKHSGALRIAFALSFPSKSDGFLIRLLSKLLHVCNVGYQFFQYVKQSISNRPDSP
jgi:hypothetical protein